MTVAAGGSDEGEQPGKKIVSFPAPVRSPPLLMRCRDTIGTPDFMQDLLAVPVHYPQSEMGGAPVGADEKFHCMAFIYAAALSVNCAAQVRCSPAPLESKHC